VSGGSEKFFTCRSWNEAGRESAGKGREIYAAVDKLGKFREKKRKKESVLQALSLLRRGKWRG
jgi:hypothetical protein